MAGIDHLPREWADLVQPLPGQFYVIRHEQAATSPSGRVLLSANFVRGIRKPTGTVVRSRLGGVSPGDVVLLSPGVGRRMTFGDRDEDPVTYYVGIGRGAYQYIWPASIEAPDVLSEGSQQGRWEPPENLSYDEQRADEGLPLEPGPND